jgi:RNA polymerase sigma-70 factor (ECF subfamily)
VGAVVLGGAGVAFVAGASFEARSSGPQPKVPAAAIQATPAPAALRNPRRVTVFLRSFFPSSVVNRTSESSPKLITVPQNPGRLGEPSNLSRERGYKVVRASYGREGRRVEERGAIERLKRGDIGGLEVLVRMHQTRALRAAYLIVRDRALAEDVVQEAFVRAYERIGRFDETRPFGPWFAKVVVNDAIKTASRRERAVRIEQDEGDDLLARVADPGAGPEGLAEEAEERRRVWAALEKLPPAQRAAIVQRYYLGLSEAEMAGREPSPPGTIKWRLHTARKRLSKLLSPKARSQGEARRERSYSSPRSGMTRAATKPSSRPTWRSRTQAARTSTRSAAERVWAPTSRRRKRSSTPPRA